MKNFQKLFGLFLALLALLLPVKAEASSEEAAQEYARKMLQYYLHYQETAEKEIRDQLRQMEAVSPNQAEIWEAVMDSVFWANGHMPVHRDVLPDGLAEDDSLCIVVLGFELNADGSMKPELLQRLKVAKASAEKYPNAFILCTGGETSRREGVSEAGEMARWLRNNGIDGSRILVEDDSLSTKANAVYSYRLLTESCPQVTSIAVVTSAYHIRCGCGLFGAVSDYYSAVEGTPAIEIVSNAVCEISNPYFDGLSNQIRGIAGIAGLEWKSQPAPELYF